MQIIAMPPGKGKTATLLQAASKDPKALIIVFSIKCVRNLQMMAKHLGIANIPPIMTAEKFLSNHPGTDQTIYVDDVDMILRQLFPGLRLITLSTNSPNRS